MGDCGLGSTSAFVDRLAINFRREIPRASTAGSIALARCDLGENDRVASQKHLQDESGPRPCHVGT